MKRPKKDWGPGGFHSLIHKEANIWTTAMVVLAAIVVFIVFALGPLLRPPYNMSNAGFIESTLQTRGLKTWSALLAPTAPLPPSVVISGTGDGSKQGVTITPVSPGSASGGNNIHIISPNLGGPVPVGPNLGTPPVAVSPPSNPPVPPESAAVFIAPQAGTVWAKGSIQTIKWNPSLVTGNVFLRLLKNGQRVAGDAAVIAGGSTGPYGDYSGEAIRNNGLFDYVVSDDVAAGSDYQVQLLASGNPVAQSPKFSIVSAPDAFKFVAPTAGESIPFGQDYSYLKWRNPTGFSGRIDIAIYQKSRGFNGLAYIAKNMPADWLYIVNGVVYFTWSVSPGNNLAQSNGNGGGLVAGDTQVIVTNVEHTLSGRSPVFSIH